MCLTVSELARVKGVSEQAIRKQILICTTVERRTQVAWECSKVPGRKGGWRIALDSLSEIERKRAMELFPDLAASAEAKPYKTGRKRRSDKGQLRPWPPARIRSTLGLSEDQCAEIDRSLRENGRRLMHKGIGERRTAQNLSLDAYDLCRSAGCTLPEAKLRSLCKISRHFVTTLNAGRFVPKMRNDAKVWADRLPGITRDWSLLGSPMECLICDVSPLDVHFVGFDGLVWKIRLIASQDGKTRRLFVHPYAPEKGEGVRMEHVAASAVWVFTQHGMPEHLICDQGGEYRCMEMLASAGLFTLHKSLPYNARAKIIEPTFASLQRFIADIPGFMGNDRMKKKTQSVGKPVLPFPGDYEHLIEAVRNAVRLYNRTPQDALGGISPDDAWEIAISDGWQPRKADTSILIEALCKKLERTVTRGAIRLNGKAYTGDDLMRRADLEGEKVTVSTSLFGFPPAVYDRSGQFVCEIHEDVAFHPLDPAGAREAGRRKTLRNQGGRELLAQHPPADMDDYRRRTFAQRSLLDDTAAGSPHVVPWPASDMTAARSAQLLDYQHTDGRTTPPEPDDEPELDYFEEMRKRKASGVKR